MRTADCPKYESADYCSCYYVQRTATRPATAITAAARLPTPWVEAPPVDCAEDAPVAEADPAEPEPPEVPVAREADVIPEALESAVVVVITAVFVHEQEES
jgi:hypothetical protein